MLPLAPDTAPENPRRRALLRTLGLGAGAAAAPAMAHAVAAPAAPVARGDALRVALLLPSADGELTAAAAAFHAGFRLAADADGAARLATVVHDTGSGVGGALKFARGQRRSRDADVAVAMVNPRSVYVVKDELAAAGVPLVVANAGEAILLPGAVGPGLVHASLELATVAYAAGQWAAANAGRRCALACSWLESGYDMAPAFRAGFEAAGGTVVLSRVTDTPRDKGDAADAGRELARSDADVVAAFYGGDEAREFFAAYRGATSRSDRVVMTSPLVTAAQAAGVAVTSVAAWSSALPHAANAALLAKFRAQYGEEPDAFAMLGYECARSLLVAHAGPGALLEGLRQPRHDDARGAVAFDPRTREIRSRLVLRSLDDAGRETAASLAFDPTSTPLGQALPRHRGWIMPYTFA